MKIDKDVPLPECAMTRIETLKAMKPGDSVSVGKEEMPRWRYPMMRVMERGDRYYFSKRHGDGYRIWRQC